MIDAREDVLSPATPAGSRRPGKISARRQTKPAKTGAQKSLRLVLETMSGICVEEAALALPLIKQVVTAQSIAGHPEWSPMMAAALVKLVVALR